MSDEILIRRTQNGWILTQYDHDDEEAYGPLTTVHEDAIEHRDQVVNEAESLADLLQEAFPFHMRAKRQPGMEITVHADSQEQAESPRDVEIPASDRWPTFRFSNSGNICDACGDRKDVVEIIQMENDSNVSVCSDCRATGY